MSLLPTIWTSLSDPTSHILVEDAADLLLEDGVGFLLLEFDPPNTVWTPVELPPAAPLS